jgi:hypothetical protein
MVRRRDILIVTVVLAIVAVGLWIAHVERSLRRVDAAAVNLGQGIRDIVTFLNYNLGQKTLVPLPAAPQARPETAEPAPKKPTPTEK